jgi:predicted RNase H-like HicB family nuclease
MIRTDDLQRHQDEPAKVEHLVGFSGGRELPTQLIGKYVDRVMLRAETKQYPSGEWFAEVPGFPGAWGSQPSEEAAEEELREALHEWVLLKIRDKDRDLPVVDSINLNVL